MGVKSLLFVIPVALAFQLPFKVPFFSATSIPSIDNVPELPTSPRVAIIGAGAAGSSAAFWISKAKERFGVDVEIDVYERSDYVGGRSTTVYPYENSSLPELELGASIFVKANKNLWRASDEFNLTRFNFTDENYDLGIWDGEKILISLSNGWLDTVKVLWRYGFSAPRKTDSIVQTMIKQFLTLYSVDAPKWDTAVDLGHSLNWTGLVETTASEYLLSQGVSAKYIGEVVEASSRVNYGQNVDEIHALGGLVSMATSGASAIEGGNFQIFEEFLNHSGANIYLNTAVTKISAKSTSSHTWTVESIRGPTDYTAVILAAPLHSTAITLPHSISDQVPVQPYIHLHVTLLATTSPMPNPAYFALSNSSSTPQTMLTTYEGVRHGGKAPEFNSLTYHGLINEEEWAVKIFSQESISDEWLNNVFFGNVGWVYRKEWDAYPKLTPTSTFPPVKLSPGFYYVNALEPFISTMETETIASRNVVDLLLQEKFNSSICESKLPVADNDDQASQTPSNHNQDFVYGWDC